MFCDCSNIIENVYTADGKKLSRTTNGVLTYYVYDGNVVIEEQDEDNDETARNVYGRNLITRETDVNKVVMGYNGHGDVIYQANSAGNIQIRYNYDEFGNVIDNSAANNARIPGLAGGSGDSATETIPTNPIDNPYRYAGYEYIKEIGIYDLNARYYNPEIARFLSADPYYNLGNRVIGLYEINVPNAWSIIQANNIYVYCGNSPILFIDPFGCHDLPVIENNQTIDVRFDLRFLLNRYNGVLKYDEETKIISMKAFGVEAEIKSTDYTLVDDHVHVTFGEFLDIFNVEYECEKAVYSVDEKGVMKQKFHAGVKSLISSFALDTVSNASKTLKDIGYGVGFLETFFGGNKSGVRTGTYLAQTYTFGTNAVLITSDKGGNSSSNHGFYADFEIKRWDFTMNTSATIDDYENGYKMPYKSFDDLIND